MFYMQNVLKSDFGSRRVPSKEFFFTSQKLIKPIKQMILVLYVILISNSRIKAIGYALKKAENKPLSQEQTYCKQQQMKILCFTKVTNFVCSFE